MSGVPKIEIAESNAPCHTANKLIIPDNVILLFQPPYCPELNPIERVWQYIKQQLENLFFTSLDYPRLLRNGIIRWTGRAFQTISC